MKLKTKFCVMIAVGVLKLRNFLDGGENLPTEKLASHRDCQLGKWLYSDGAE